MNIYVGNLPYGLREEELNDAFAEFGEVISAKIIRDRFTDKSKGFGFVEMRDDSTAEAAIKALDGKDMQGRPLRVNEARPRDDRPGAR